jgi:hypothetical protein
MGMNSAGLTFIQNTSDTLNSPFAEAFNEGLIFGNLLPKGIPIGMVCREVISKYQTVDQALEYLGKPNRRSVGTCCWRCRAPDDGRRTRRQHLRPPRRPHADLRRRCRRGGNLDEHGLPYASLGPDDLRMARTSRKK